jgi:predicted nucleotidyltransferase
MKTWTPPTAEEIERAIQEMVRRIVEGFDPEKIILFGSQARGDAGPDSDVDLLVVMPTDSKRDTAVSIGVALHAMGISKDVIVVTPDEFERRKNIVGTVAYPAHHEGRILYERPRP